MKVEDYRLVINTSTANFWTNWDKISNNNDYQHPMYNIFGVKYYKEYFVQMDGVQDVSLVVVYEDIPLIGMVGSISNHAGKVVLSGFGRGLNVQENCMIEKNKLKNARIYLKKYIEKIVSDYHINEIHFRDYSQINGSVSFFARYFLDKGAQSKIWYLQLVDLSKSLEKIKSGFAKSCRNSINSAQKNFTTQVIITDDGDAIRRLSELHFVAAGKETRDPSTWLHFLDMIKNNKAFIVEAWKNDLCVASALFIHDSNICLYSVSAANRDWFGTPVNHGIIWEAMRYSQSIGCKKFEFGGLYYSKTDSRMTEKEKRVNRFKKNFGGSTKMQLELYLEI